MHSHLRSMCEGLPERIIAKPQPNRRMPAGLSESILRLPAKSAHSRLCSGPWWFDRTDRAPKQKSSDTDTVKRPSRNIGSAEKWFYADAFSEWPGVAGKIR